MRARSVAFAVIASLGFTMAFVACGQKDDKATAKKASAGASPQAAAEKAKQDAAKSAKMREATLQPAETCKAPFDKLDASVAAEGETVVELADLIEQQNGHWILADVQAWAEDKNLSNGDSIIGQILGHSSINEESLNAAPNSVVTNGTEVLCYNNKLAEAKVASADPADDEAAAKEAKEAKDNENKDKSKIKDPSKVKEKMKVTEDKVKMSVTLPLSIDRKDGKIVSVREEDYRMSKVGMVKSGGTVKTVDLNIAKLKEAYPNAGTTLIVTKSDDKMVIRIETFNTKDKSNVRNVRAIGTYKPAP